MRKSFTWMKWAVLASSIWLTGCGTISTMGKLETGAAGEASRMWDRWVEGEGDNLGAQSQAGCDRSRSRTGAQASRHRAQHARCGYFAFVQRTRSAFG